MSTLVYLFFGAIFAVTHLVALKADLYWYFWWFDILMHSWGGFLVVSGLVVLRGLPGVGRFVPSSKSSIATFLMMIMVAWEVFEYFIGTGLKTEFWFDTLLDVIVGSIGGYVAYVLFSKPKESNT
jgi:hypothetical protein